MKLLKKKLKNTGGATMLLALLFFLLCTVVASILIVASTVNSGRLSKLAKSDARYYAVESAAELLCDSINEKTVTVKLIKRSTTTTVYRCFLNSSGTAEKTLSSSRGDINPSYSIKLSADNLPERDADGGLSFLTDLALTITAGSEMGAVDTVKPWNENFVALSTAITKPMTVAVGSDGNLTVTAEATLSREGVLTIVLKNASESEDQYQMKLTFDADLQRVDTSSTSNGTPAVKANTDGSYNETTDSIVTNNRNYTVCWHLTSVERGKETHDEKA